jgi:hypothetical protein
MDRPSNLYFGSTAVASVAGAFEANLDLKLEARWIERRYLPMQIRQSEEL